MLKVGNVMLDVTIVLKMDKDILKNYELFIEEITRVTSTEDIFKRKLDSNWIEHVNKSRTKYIIMCKLTTKEVQILDKNNKFHKYMKLKGDKGFICPKE